MIPKRERLPNHEAVPGRILFKCLHEECDKQAESRGLCRSHATFISKAVKEGKFTWKDLEERGKTLPKGYVRKYNTLAWFNAPFIGDEEAAKVAKKIMENEKK